MKEDIIVFILGVLTTLITLALLGGLKRYEFKDYIESEAISAYVFDTRTGKAEMCLRPIAKVKQGFCLKIN